MLSLLSLLQLPPSLSLSGVSRNWEFRSDLAMVEQLFLDSIITEGMISISWTSVSDFSCSMKTRMEADRAVERVSANISQMNRIGSTVSVR